MAVFLGAYIWFSEGQVISLAQLTLAVALGLLIWAVFETIRRPITNQLIHKIASNIVPSVIILTDGDSTAYSKFMSALNSPVTTLIKYGSVIVVTVILNVFSGYIYTYLTST